MSQVLDELAVAVEAIEPDKVMTLCKRAMDEDIDATEIVKKELREG